MEPTLKKLTMITSGNVAASLYPIATRTTNQLTREVTLRRIRICVISADWPSQQITNIPTWKKAYVRIGTRPIAGIH